MASTGVLTAQTVWRWAWPDARGWVDALDSWLADERDHWPLWLPVMLGLGIAAWFLLPWRDERIACAVLLAGAGVAGLTAGRLWARLLGIGSLVSLLGLGVAAWRADAVAAPILRGERLAAFTATVESVEDVQARDRWRLILTPDDASIPTARLGVRGRSDAAVLPGAKVKVRAMLSAPGGPPLPGGYDFARREFFEGVGAVGYALGAPVLVRPAPPPSAPVAWLETARLRLTRWLEAGVRGQGGAVSAAFITGDEGAISPETMTDFRASGLAHLLSVSGLHIAVVIGLTMWSVRRLVALWPWLALRVSSRSVAAVAAALAGIAYTVLAGTQIPAVRSCLAALVVLLGLLLGRESVSLRLVAGGALFILLARPEALLNPSFQMSFAAITGLVALYQSPTMKRWTRVRPGDGVFARMGRHWAALLLSGMVAEGMLAPASMYHFQQAGLYGMFANLVAIPFTEFVIMPLLGLVLVLGSVGLAQPAFWGVRLTMGWLLRLAHWVGTWPGAQLRWVAMGDGAFALMALGGLWLCLWQRPPRFLGLAPVAAGMIMALGVRPPDVLVSNDGRQVAVRDEQGRFRMLRDRGGDYQMEMWGKAWATDAVLPFADREAACSDEACVAWLDRGGTRWRLLATRSKEVVDRDRFEPACRAADIVVSDRRLPRWCSPRWLRLDRAALGRTGALALALGPQPMVTSVAARAGDHPWRPVAEPRRTRRRYSGTKTALSPPALSRDPPLLAGGRGKVSIASKDPLTSPAP